MPIDDILIEKSFEIEKNEMDSLIEGEESMNRR
jgi:hypothetical protein